MTLRAGTTPGSMTAGILAPDTGGEVLVRVVYSNDTQGHRSLDSVYVVELMIRTDLDPTDTAPEPPTGFIATALSASKVELLWSDRSANELDFEVLRSTDAINFSSIGTTVMNSTSYVDETALANTDYTY